MAATTYIDICNAALIRIGLPTIASFSDGSTTANACNNRWASCRDIVLRMHPWDCATSRVVLAPSNTPPAFGWLYAFPKPADFLRELEVSNNPQRGPNQMLGARPEYKIESGNILFNYNALYLVYINQVSNAGQLDSLCAQALANYIAYDLAQLLLQNEDLVKSLNAEFEATMTTARNVNADENQGCLVIDAFERARLWGPS